MANKEIRMKRIFIFFVLLLTSPAFASSILSDQLILEGKPFPLHQSPLDSYFSANGLNVEKIFSKKCAEELHGYQATWEVKSDFLFLIAIK